ncbi:ABC transporter permease [Frigidibacter sp. ROC022]|uniref:ABC transporter permease n=1 Tax=Frigidibacter sp. ROC022 TaxID=2971796 RepID=UPI00215AC9AF|nr:ABC transporter permease [Frigidibacter sp. ROC022]MCR8724662.1 ABC transporter permease [Frigidibacter sp. ROC022]
MVEAADTAGSVAEVRTVRPAWWRFARHRLSVVAAILILAVFGLALLAPVLPIPDPDAITSVDRLLPPGSSGYLLGTDELGRDVLSRLIWGARISLLAGFGAAFLSLLLGCAMGLLAGFMGRWIDNVLMRVTDVVLAFPTILLAIGVLAAVGPGLTNAMLAVAISGLPLYARVARGSVLSVRELDYVEAARSIGASTQRIMVRHVLPNILAPLIVAFTLDVGMKIVVTSSLSFLGLGAQPPTADWGSMIASGRNYIRNAPHLIMIPGAAIFFVVLCLNIIGDRLRDILDPRLKDL